MVYTWDAKCAKLREVGERYGIMEVMNMLVCIYTAWSLCATGCTIDAEYLHLGVLQSHLDESKDHGQEKDHGEHARVKNIDVSG